MGKAIMIQGTMSSAGKSVIAAGLCRIFHQDGYRTAPFKSQNMALNSYITREGLEMGRAQVMQAQAAGTEPSVDMNPILLKPVNDTGSQVIVHGEVVGNMSAREYFEYKKNLVPVIRESYDRLAAENDIIVIEGAGSPAEINLNQNDIVNMGMAKMASAPVLLVGDIDRGGVFAQLTGTVMLLGEEERAMVKGLIINKFRGDKSILDPGIQMLEDKCSIPVVGTVPYLNLALDDEDSLTERFSEEKYEKADGNDSRTACVDIAVIRLPRISNFTDFNVLEALNGVRLRYVSSVDKLGHPDMIILPGTKNTMGDLKWLRQCGLEAAVKKASSEGTVIFGICGGYQMMGNTLSDPEGVEEGGRMRGMGLIPTETVFTSRKTRTRVKGSFASLPGVFHPLSAHPLEGYEIHMGITTRHGECRNLTGLHAVSGRQSEDKYDGACTADGSVCGTYVHGIFDSDGTAEKVAEALAGRAGKKLSGTDFGSEKKDYRSFEESQYDILAAALRRSLSMEKIYQILREGIT